MFSEIDDLNENLILSEKIKNLLIVLDRNYFSEIGYDFRKTEDAFELCGNYNDMQVLVETILDLSVENSEKLRKKISVLVNKDRELKEGKQNAEYQY